MDEMNLALPPGLDAALNEFYAAPQPDPAFAARLEAQLRRHHSAPAAAARPRPPATGTKGSFMYVMRTRPALAAAAALLALLLLTGVAYALGRLTGFIPGFGFTTGDKPVYVLAETVERSAGGITLRADQAVEDGEQFWVQLAVAGLAEREDFSNAYILLPDGEKIRHESGRGSRPDGGDEYKLSYLFPAFPGRPQELTLLVEGLGGQDFSLPLKLRPARAGEIMPAPPEGEVRLQSESHNGVRLALDHIAADGRKTVFQVSLQYEQPNTWIGAPWNVTLSDETGTLYPLADVTPDTMTGGDTHVYQTVPFNGTESLVLTLVTFPPSDSLPLYTDFSGDSPSFTFDPGPNPAAGRKWELNEVLSAGGHELKVLTATLTDEPGLLFEIEPGPFVTGVMFYSPDPLVTGSIGGVPVQSGNLTSGMTFSEIPQQPIEIQLMRIYYRAEGAWQIHWRPPAAPTPAADLPTPTHKPTSPPSRPTSLPAESDPILLEVQRLAQRFDAPFQAGAGWVHVVYETHTNPQAGQNYPPPYLRTEQWVETGPDGYVTRLVWLDYDEAGTIIQQSATVGDYSVNFTTGDTSFNNGERYRFSMDMLTRDLSAAVKYGSSVTREEMHCLDGRPCLLITLADRFAEPVQNHGEPEAFSGAGRHVWIDLETGQQVKHQSFWLLEDGSERATSTMRFTLVEKAASPPQEILDILARAVVP